MNLQLKQIKKVLILRYRFIGDTVLAVPFVKNVREAFPGAQIDVLVSPNSGELLENNPNIDNVIYLDTTRFHKYENQKAEAYKSIFSCAAGLKKEKYDLVFVLKRSFSSALLAYLTGAKHRVGFNTELRSFLLTHTVKYKEDIHEAENFLNCLRAIGIEPKKHIPEVFPTEEEKRKAQGFLVRLDRFKPKVLIHGTSAHPYKQWPKRYIAKVMDYLFEEFDVQFVFTGAKIDKEFYEQMLKWSKKRRKFKILDLCGLTTLRECFPLYQGLDLALCVDSGNSHLAAAVGIPTYIIYGPTKPEKWLPLGKEVFPVRLKQLLSCQPCDVKVKCNHLSCMKLLTPEKVFQNLKEGQKETQYAPAQTTN